MTKIIHELNNVCEKFEKELLYVGVCEIGKKKGYKNKYLEICAKTYKIVVNEE